MPPLVEPRARPLPGLREILTHAFGHNLVNGTSAFLFAASGPGAMVLAIGAADRLPDQFIIAWLFAGYAFNGLVSIVVCWLYRQPFTFGYSIPAIVIVGPALAHYPIAQIVGAYVVTGALILALALTGLIRRFTAALPEPIAMAMVAGLFLPFGLRLIGAFEHGAWVAGAMATGGFTAPPGLALKVASPVAFRPAFSTGALLELVLPLTVTVLAIHNIQGFAILRSAGFAPPERLAALVCGTCTVLFGISGSVPTAVTGPVNAILNVSGARETRYVAGMWCGLLFVLFGLFAPTAVQAGSALPGAFIAGLAGLAILPVLQTAFVESFRGAFTFGALVTFLITVSGVQILGIGGVFWGLVFGYAASRLVERADFRRLRGPDSFTGR